MGKKKNSDKNDTNDFRREERLQAVVLADSFQLKMRPITAERPKVLLPLVNQPMIDYTMEFLVSSGVEEIFVLTCAHAKQVQAYLDKSRWTQKKEQFTIRVVVSENSFSAGDALRHLDSLNVIEDDFVLVSGDIISNIKLDTVLKEHKARVKQDKRNVMTVVMKKASQNHRTRSLDDDLVVAVAKESGQLLFYNDNPQEKKVTLDSSLWEEHEAVQFRYDLMDSHIDICTPEVLMLFTDNFDYQDVRRDFIPGLLGSEILGNKIFTHEISGAYAARLKDLRTYDSVSRDVIHRWTFPMVPDVNLFGNSSYKHYRNCNYREDDVKLDRSCNIGDEVVVGARSVIGANTTVSSTVIGRDCQIGNNCTIVGSYLWGGVVIEDGVSLDRVIVCDGAIVRKGATVEKGSILSFGTVIGNDFTVKPYTAISCVEHIDEEGFSGDDEEEESEAVYNEEDVGAGGKGFIYEAPEDEDDDEDEEERPLVNTIAPEGKALVYTVHSDVSDISEEEEAEEEEGEGGEEANMARFYNEVRETVRRGHFEKLPPDAIELEMASLKLSYHATVPDYSAATFMALLSLTSLPSPVDYQGARCKATKTVMGEMNKAFNHWKCLLVKFGRESQDQTFLVEGLAKVCVKHPLVYAPLFQLLLKMMYEGDVAGEDAVLEWEEGVNTDGTDEEQALAKSASMFLDWLREAEESDEGDEGESEESD